MQACLRFLRRLVARPWRLAGLLVAVAGLLVAGAESWAWWHFRQANQLAEQYQFSAAYEHYLQSLRVWRWSASTHLLAGRAARRGLMYREAHEQYEESRRLAGNDPRLAASLALEKLLMQAQNADLTGIEEVLWNHIDKNKAEAPLVLEAMARGYVSVLRLGIAMRCLKMLLEQEPQNVDALLLRAWVYERTGDPANAARDYREALRLSPGRFDARLSLAKLLLRDNRDGPEEGSRILEELRAEQPDNREVLLELARAYRALGESEKARPCLDALLMMSPKHSAALSELAMLTRDQKEAESLLRRAIEADPANLEAHFQLYLLLVNQPGREQEAAAQLQRHKRVKADMDRLMEIASKEMSKHPEDVGLYCELGTLYLHYAMPEVGIRWLNKGLTLDPANQSIHQALYEYYQRVGDTEKAEEHRRQLRAGNS